MIYFIQCSASGLTKVGYAADPIARAKQLRTGIPGDAVITALGYGDRHVESRWHRLLAPFRGSGEWFSLTDVPPTSENLRGWLGPLGSLPPWTTPAPAECAATAYLEAREPERAEAAPILAAPYHPITQDGPNPLLTMSFKWLRDEGIPECLEADRQSGLCVHDIWRAAPGYRERDILWALAWYVGGCYFYSIRNGSGFAAGRVYLDAKRLRASGVDLPDGCDDRNPDVPPGRALLQGEGPALDWIRTHGFSDESFISVEEKCIPRKIRPVLEPWFYYENGIPLRSWGTEDCPYVWLNRAVVPFAEILPYCVRLSPEQALLRRAEHLKGRPDKHAMESRLAYDTIVHRRFGDAKAGPPKGWIP